MSIAVLIAVEEYEADDIEGVRFAERDVARLSPALAALGCDASDQTLLVSSGATRRAVESALREAADAAAANDALYLYYSGRGFSQGGANYLTCCDTSTSDPVATSIALEWVFGLLRQSSCQKVVMFLDSCHRGTLGGDGASHGLLGRADGELKQFFGDEPDRVCLAPCQSHQVSWFSRRNQHGPWAHNLIGALGGDPPAALRGGSLFAAGWPCIATLVPFLPMSLARVEKGRVCREEAALAGATPGRRAGINGWIAFMVSALVSLGVVLTAVMSMTAGS